MILTKKFEFLSKLTFLPAAAANLLRRLILGEVHYVGSGETLPPPLSKDIENRYLNDLSNPDKRAAARKILIEHNLRLVVYIRKHGYPDRRPCFNRQYRAYKGNQHL